MDSQNSANGNQAQTKPILNGSESLSRQFNAQPNTNSTPQESHAKTDASFMTQANADLRHVHSHYQSSNSSVAINASTWWQWLLHSASAISSDSITGHSLREPLLLGLSGDRFVAQQGLQKRIPGVRYYSQGTEETSRPKHPIHPSVRPISHSQTVQTKSTIISPELIDTHPSTNSNANIKNIHSSNCVSQDSTPQNQQRTGSFSATSVTPATPIALARSNMTSSSSVTTSARNNGDSEENTSHSSPSPSSSSPSSSPPSPPSSPVPTSGRSDPATKNNATVYVGTRTSTSVLLFSTSQEFGQVWAQTTAFLHRTFSPTYRVGTLYLESWTNGTQTRGLERLRASLVRGDALVLVRSMTGQLKDLWKRSIAEATEIERRTRAIEGKTNQSSGVQGKGNTTSSPSSTSSSSSNSSDSGSNESQK